MKNSNSMTKNVMWNSCGSTFYSMCQWVITILVVHLTSYEVAGVLALAMSVSSSFAAISLFSMRNYQVSDIKQQYSNNVYVSSRVITCFLGIIICLGASFFISENSSDFLCVNAFMLIRTAEASVDVLHGVNQGYVRYDIIGKSYIMRGFVIVIFFCIGLKLTGDLAITLIVVAVINLVIVYVYDWKQTNQLGKIVLNIKESEIIDLLKKCAPIVIFAFLLSAENVIAKKFLQAQYGNEMLGIYSSMASPTLIVQVFASVAFNPFLPGLMKMFWEDNIEEFKKTLVKVVLLLAASGIIITLGATLLGKFGLVILFKESILTYYSLFIPIVWVTILTAYVWIMSSIVIGLRKIKLLVIGMIINFLLSTSLVVPIIRYCGPNGASIVQIISLAIYIIYLLIICATTIKEHRKNQIN